MNLERSEVNYFIISRNISAMSMRIQKYTYNIVNKTSYYYMFLVGTVQRLVLTQQSFADTYIFHMRQILNACTLVIFMRK